jgi:putative FmdB family regulatory protein
MPLYEYKCAKCGEVFELRQKFSDEPLHEHPGCGGAVEKLISAPTLQFKGSGWYVNDYGRNGSTSKERSKHESDSKSSDSKSSDSKSSDSKSSDSKSSDSKKTETAKPAATSAKEAPTAAKS